MQFTEMSELNRIIGMMRTAAWNSPTFHDRQDSEVDRIYNSSPKMELPMRDSWMDKMAIKDVPTPNHAYKNPGSGDSVMQNDGSKGFEPSKNEKFSKSKEKSENGPNPTAKDTKKNVSSKKGTEADTVHNTKETGMQSKECDSKSPNEGGIEFTKEPVQPISYHETSLLENILRGGVPVHGQKANMLANDGALLHLTIYLPTKSEMNVDLHDNSTVDESIQEVLRLHQLENRQPSLYYGHPECYELRLHDADGYPDEDFPALDRSRKIKNFGDAGGHEYCLCERPDACPPADDNLAETTRSSMSHSKSEGGPSFANSVGISDKMFLKIYLPKSDDYTVVAVDATTIGQDLLPTLNKKHRLQLFQDQYVLKISEAERERLDLPTDEIDLHTKLRPLNLHEVTLAIKQYADAPQVPVSVTNAVDDAANIDGRSRPPPETFMFNDLTAGVYKEWHVIKKNKYGKKQKRMLGIDINKIYNRKVGERVIKSRTTTKIAERPITSVEWVRFMQDPSDFQIYFKDHIEEIVTDYTADSPYECAEIVAKLKYILSRKK